MEKLGSFVKGLRNAAGISHEQLADKTSLSRYTIINLEGDDSVRFETLRAVLNALDISQNDWAKAANLWIRQQIGDADYEKYCVSDAGRKLLLQERAALNRDAEKLSQALSPLSPPARTEIIRALQQPHIVESVRILNSYSEKIMADAGPAARKKRVLYDDGPDAPAARVSESKPPAGKPRGRKLKKRGAS